MEVILPFVTNSTPPAQRRNKKSKTVKRKIIKIHNSYTPVELYNMDDPQLEYLYEHGSPAEREVASEILKKRQKWDIILNKSLDDPLPSGSGLRGSPSAGGR